MSSSLKAYTDDTALKPLRGIMINIHIVMNIMNNVGQLNTEQNPQNLQNWWTKW